MSGADSDQWLPAQPGGIKDLLAWEMGDGTAYFASAGSDGTVKVFDGASGELVGRPLVGHVHAVFTLGYWREGEGVRLVSSGTDGFVCVWDPHASALIGRFDTDHLTSVRSLACWSGPEGVRVATGGYDATVRIWDPLTGTRIGEPFEGHTGPVAELICWEGADGEWLVASAGDDGMVRVWNPRDGSLVCGPLDSGSGVEDLSTWSGPEGSRYLAAGSSQTGIVHIWDLSTAGSASVRIDVGRGLWAMTSWADGVRLLATGDSGGYITLWDAATGRETGVRLRGSPMAVNALAHWRTPQGGIRIASGLADGRIRGWDIGSDTAVYEITTGHTASVWSVVSWQTGAGQPRLASAGADGVIRVWDPDSGRLLCDSTEYRGPGVWALATWSELDGRTRLCSGTLDGRVRFWDAETCTPIGTEFVAHVASVSAFAIWRTPDGTLRLASGGDEAVVRVWDLATGDSVGEAIQHPGGVMVLTCWQSANGATTMVSIADRTVRIWDPDTGLLIREEVINQARGLDSLCSWQDEAGTHIALGGYDGMIRVWNLDTTPITETVLSGHIGTIRALTAWVRPDGRARLASAGADGIRVWDPASARAIGAALTNHRAGLRTMTSWETVDGVVRLASAGDDGTVKMWDPERGIELRTVEVGAVGIWGLSDSPAQQDLLDRTVLVNAIADQVSPPIGSAENDMAGPAIVTIEGPWGCGKSTLMELVRQKISAGSDHPAHEGVRPRRLTVRGAMKLLKRPAPPGPGPAAAPRRGVVTAWFNPWAHQSGEQIWAGLTEAIVEAVEPALYPSEAERERYWFAHNIVRLDRYALYRTLRRRIVSPLWGVALVTVALPLALAIGQLGRSFRLLDSAVAAVLAVTPAVVLLLAGAVHSAYRYFRGWAVGYLPYDVFSGPVSMSGLSVPTAVEPGEAGPIDPLRQAARGSLYLHQHDVSEMMADVNAAGYSLIVFIDDLDRCRAATISEVFEAVNLFLTGLTSGGYHARFVIGVDPAVVAAHLDSAYETVGSHRIGPQGDDPSIGWAFLRKLVQLPVTVPRISSQAISSFVDRATGEVGAILAVPFSSVEATPVGVPGPPASESPQPVVAQSASAPARSVSPARALLTGRTIVQTVPWRLMEKHPRVRGLLVERLAAQPDRSIREAKRLINIWQLYERVLSAGDPIDDPVARIDRARHLVVLAEIIARWPALQPFLNRHDAEQHGLRILAEAVDDDEAWQLGVARLGIDPERHRKALANLRGLLEAYDGKAVADLAHRLM
ncbi:P-loop NTPase fold protein [Nocardia sp. NPDC004340]